MATSAPPTLGVIIGNRDFFPDQLVAEARADVLAVLAAAGVTPVIVSPEETKRLDTLTEPSPVFPHDFLSTFIPSVIQNGTRVNGRSAGPWPSAPQSAAERW